ncbi:hypothetical protein HQ496_12830 [bacterium]|nr:hypothetical protein [bacterium]
MRKLSVYILLFGLMLVGVACDNSSSDDPSDGDAFIGSWSLGGVNDAEGDRTAAFIEGFNSVLIGFERDGGFTLNVDAVVDAGDANYSGEYGIVESNTTVSVSIVANGTSLPLTFSYNIVDDKQIKLTAAGTTSVLLASLFSTSFTAPVTITLVKG